MNITVNDQCTSILVESTSFNATNISNSLSVKVNDEVPIELTPNSNVSSYTFTPNTLGLDEFEEGVYEISLTSTLNNSTVSKDKGCTAVICKLKCDVNTLDLYKDSTQILKVMALEGLQSATDCVACSCEVMKDFYKIINEDNESTCSCGCCKTAL